MKIIQYKWNIPIRKYNTITDIQKKKGYLKSHISECLNGKRKTAYGYKWKYQIRKKGRLKYWFKSKDEMIKDVTFLCDRCEEYESTIKKAIEIIDLITPELWNISNKMTYRLKDIKYILQGKDENK